MKYPCIICDSYKWKILKPQLESLGFNTKFVYSDANWERFPLLVVNAENIFGICLNLQKHTHTKYNRELIDNIGEFLNILKIMKAENFTKSDLKDGMIVEIKGDTFTNCKKYLVSNGLLVSNECFLDLNFYDNDLTHKANDIFTIVKVFHNPNWTCGFSQGLNTGNEIWGRTKVKTITIQEIANLLGVDKENLNIIQ